MQKPRGRKFGRAFAVASSLAALVSISGCGEEENISGPSDNVGSRVSVSTPPETIIDRQYLMQSGEFVIEFRGFDQDGDLVTGFEYRVDNQSWTFIPRSPLVMAPTIYDPGIHVVEVRTLNNRGEKDPTPARTTFNGKSQENVLTSTTNAQGNSSLVINRKEISVSTRDATSTSGITGVNLEGISYRNTSIVSISANDPPGRYWPLAISFDLNSRGKAAADVGLEMRLERIPPNSKPYTIFSADPLSLEATRSSLRFIGSFPLRLAIDYFRSRDNLQDAIDMMEFLDGIAKLGAGESLYVATNLNKFRREFIESIPEIMQTVASFVGENADMDIIYYDIREQSFLRSNIVSLTWNPKLTTLKGKVTSNTGTPIAGADISQMRSSLLVRKTSSGANGNYLLYYTETGASTIVVSHPNYTTINDNSWLQDGRIFREPTNYTMTPTQREAPRQESLKELVLQPGDGKDAETMNIVCTSCSNNSQFSMSYPDDLYGHVGRDIDQGSYIVRRSYIQFDLSGVQGRVEKAYLELYCRMIEDPIGARDRKGRFGVRRVSSYWSERGLEWNNQPDFERDYQDAIEIDTNEGWRRWDVTRATASWISGFSNFGLVLLSVDEGREGFFSFNTSDHPNQQLKPKLIIQYK